MKSTPKYVKLMMFMYLSATFSGLLFVCTVITQIDRRYCSNDSKLKILDRRIVQRNFPYMNSSTNIYTGFLKNVSELLSSANDLRYKQSIFNVNFPVLPSWDNRNLLLQTSIQRYKAFEQRISASQYKEMIELLDGFSTICVRNKVTFMLYGGSLLGSYRHFGFIPWDDDIDVLVNNTDRDRLKVLLNTQDYEIESPDNRQWKFYKKTNRRKCSQQHLSDISTLSDNYRHNCSKVKWPYIDIFMFEENATHVWDSTPMYRRTYVYPKHEVFPLTLNPFEESLLSIPKCPQQVLSKTYNIDLCVTPTYSHIFENIPQGRQLSVPCKRLHKYFPFVFETNSNGFIFRRLLLNTKVLFEVKQKTLSC